MGQFFLYSIQHFHWYKYGVAVDDHSPPIYRALMDRQLPSMPLIAYS